MTRPSQDDMERQGLSRVHSPGGGANCQQVAYALLKLRSIEGGKEIGKRVRCRAAAELVDFQHSQTASQKRGGRLAGRFLGRSGVFGCIAKHHQLRGWVAQDTSRRPVGGGNRDSSSRAREAQRSAQELALLLGVFDLNSGPAQ